MEEQMQLHPPPLCAWYFTQQTSTRTGSITVMVDMTEAKVYRPDSNA
jgi:hypothetical protein